MREIKFRGYNKDLEEWSYGLLQKDNYTNKYYINDFLDIDGFAYVEEDSIGEYTGFKDKNREEIYEGDIVEWSDDKLEIKLVDGCWYGITIKSNFEDEINVMYELSGLSDIEVVGNVYEEQLNGNKRGISKEKNDN